MKKQSLLFLAICISTMASVQAQTNWLWAKSMGGINADQSKAVASDSYGNIYTAGTFTGTVDFDPGPATFYLNSIPGSGAVFISKLNNQGNFVWAKTLTGTGGNGGASTSSMVLDTSGNIYTTGSFFGTIDFDPDTGIFILTGPGVFISKLDGSGNFVWAQLLDISGNANAIVLDPAGSGAIFTTGNFSGFGDFDPGAGTFFLISAGSNEDIFISRLDSLGNFVWAKAMGGTGNDMGLSMDVDDSGNIFATGKFEGTSDFDPGTGIFNMSSTGNYDIFIARLNASGDLVWAKAMGGLDADEGWSLAVDPSGRYVYATGRFEGTCDFDPGASTFNLTIPGNYSIFINKLDSAGSFVWAKGVGGAGYDIGRFILIDESGSIYTTGNFAGTIDFDPGAGTYYLSANAVDAFVSKLDSLGSFVWAKAVGGAGYEYGECIAIDSGDIVLTGLFDSPSINFGASTVYGAGSFDAFVAKLDQLITGIRNAEHTNNCNVYPNPAGNYIALNFAQHYKEMKILVTDLAGKIIFTARLSNTNKIEMNTLEFEEGIYFVNMQAADLNETRKFVIAR